MPVTELAYVDESYDGDVFCMSALILPTATWRAAFLHLQAHRRRLKARHGIFTSKELHATEFVAGRGRIAPGTMPKGLRAFLFKEQLDVIAALPGAAVISGAGARAGSSLRDIHARAFSRIQERLQRRCVANDSHALMLIDQGKETELRSIARRSRTWNPVGSQYGRWEDGASYKNIPNDRLIEDPIFKESHQSYFLQAADFIAFALLKSEVSPTAHVARYGLPPRPWELSGRRVEKQRAPLLSLPGRPGAGPELRRC